MADEPWWKQGIAELIGAFALVLVGAGSAIATSAQGFDPSTAFLARGLAIGMVIAAMASALSHVSGGQITPAVTVGLLAAGRIRGTLALAIVGSQLLGSVLAALLLRAIYPASASLGTPQLGAALAPVESTVSTILGIAIELVLTFFLVFVVFSVAVDPRGAARQVSGLPIGLAAAMAWFVGGNLTGAALSPGRWLGPALVTMNFGEWYVYTIGPLVGGTIAGVLYAQLFMPRES